jgi:hypothetical protein
MNTLAVELTPLANSVHCENDELVVQLKDGRTLSVPLAWFPRLVQADAKARAHFEILGNGEGIHWPTLDEDISIKGLLAGRASHEYSNKNVKE